MSTKKKHDLKDSTTMPGRIVGPRSLKEPEFKARARTPAPPRQVNIVILVDVVDALIANQPEGSTYMFTDKKSGSSGVGTDHLTAHVRTGDTVAWWITGLEVETFLEINQIAGLTPDVCNVQKVELPITHWQGLVGDQKGCHEYSLALRVENKLMTLTNVALSIS